VLEAGSGTKFQLLPLFNKVGPVLGLTRNLGAHHATSITMYCTSNCQMTFVSNSNDAMFFRYETKEGIKPNSPIKDPILKKLISGS